MRTCLSSFFCSENTPNSNYNFLIKSMIVYELSSHIEKASTLHIPARCLEPSRASSPFPPFSDVDSLLSYQVMGTWIYVGFLRLKVLSVRRSILYSTT